MNTGNITLIDKARVKAPPNIIFSMVIYSVPSVHRILTCFKQQETNLNKSLIIQCGGGFI